MCLIPQGLFMCMCAFGGQSTALVPSWNTVVHFLCNSLSPRLMIASLTIWPVSFRAPPVPSSPGPRGGYEYESLCLVLHGLQGWNSGPHAHKPHFLPIGQPWTKDCNQVSGRENKVNDCCNEAGQGEHIKGLAKSKGSERTCSLLALLSHRCTLCQSGG